MFWRKAKPAQRQRPSKFHQETLHNDQQPFLTRARFSALPLVQHAQPQENLSLFFAIIYVIDMFGVFPFVTLPALIVELGILGVPLVISIVVLQIYTSFLLSRCWIMAENLDSSIVLKKRYPYAAIADLAYGPYLSGLVRFMLDLSIFFMSIPNIVVAAQNLQLAGYHFGLSTSATTYCYWVLFVGIFMTPLMWLGSPKHMRVLVIIAVCVVFVVVVLLWYCLLAASPLGMRPFEGIGLDLPEFLSVLRVYSVLAFQFDMHSMLLVLKIDMQQKSQVRWAAFTGITVTSTVAIIGSLIAAYKFGSMIAQNLLETLPTTSPLVVLLIMMSLQLCFSTVVGSSGMFLQIENFLKIPETFSIKRIVLRGFIVALELLIAEFVPQFADIMEIVGGTIIGPLVFIIPPLLYRRIYNMERTHQRMAIESAYGSIPLDLNYESPTTNVMYPSKKFWDNLFGDSCRRLPYNLKLSMSVLVFGVCASFLSTYLNIFKISAVFNNNSPCFGSNFTFSD